MAIPDEAAVLLGLAQDDLDHVRAMLAMNLATSAIFGFHAQQAVEKAAKAWLLARGRSAPWTHDLNRLLGQLAAIGVLPHGLADELTQLTVFAVQFR